MLGVLCLLSVGCATSHRRDTAMLDSSWELPSGSPWAATGGRNSWSNRGSIPWERKPVQCEPKSFSDELIGSVMDGMVQGAIDSLLDSD